MTKNPVQVLTELGQDVWPMEVPMSSNRALVTMALALGLTACAEAARLPVSAGMGRNPTLPAPKESLIPTVNVAPAKGWPTGAKPVAAPGTSVTAFAAGLRRGPHASPPRCLH